MRSISPQKISLTQYQAGWSARHSGTSGVSEAHLKALIESTDDLIWSVDLNFRVVAFNGAFAEAVRSSQGVAVESGMDFGHLPCGKTEFWCSVFGRTLNEGSIRTTLELEDGRRFELALNRVMERGRIVGISCFAKDITERAQAESLLKVSEQRFRTLIEKAPTSVAACRDGIRLYVNDRYAEMFGLSAPDQAVGQSVYGSWAPKSAAVLKEYARRQARGETVPNELEGTAQRLDGTRFPVHVAVTQVELPDGPATVSFFTDMTERRLAEAALRDNEVRFRSYFELPMVGMAATSLEKRFLMVNDHTCEILGYTRDELLGLDWAAITHPQDLDGNVKQFDRLLAGEIDRYSLEKRFIRKDGQAIWTKISVGCVRKPDGTADYICVIMDDISRQKAAEEAIRIAEREYRTIFEEAPEGIFKATKDGKSVALNPSGARKLGFASAEEGVAAFTNTPMAVWYNPDDRAAAVAEVDQKGEIRDVHRQFKRKDGSPLWVSLTARDVKDENGNSLYYQGFFEDISERKRLEAESAAQLREVRILSEMNSAMLRARSEHELLKEYCRIIVETAGYRMAWVGYAENLEKRIVPMAWAGLEDGYLSAVRIMWDGSEYSNSTPGRAVMSGKIQAFEDLSAEPDYAIYLPEARKRGFVSSISLPFHVTSDAVACLTAYGTTPNQWSESERRLMDQVASALAYGIRTLRDAIAKERSQRDLRTSLEQTIQLIAETIDQRDPYTAGHQRRVANLCAAIGRKLGLDQERVHGLRLAASIHDLGKIGIPAEILNRPGRLTPIQLSLVQEHAQLGFEMIKNVQFPWPIADMVHQHHERMDGSGYPQGLGGDSILLESRILGVADVVESMATHRPYRPSRGIDAALDEVLLGRGSRYDADVVDACVSLFREDGYVLPA